jgi:hypothetical protein
MRNFTVSDLKAIDASQGFADAGRRYQAPSQSPAALDRVADCLLQQGNHHQAERLAHQAAAMRQGGAA